MSHLGTTTDDGYLVVRVLKCEDYILADDLTLHLTWVGHGSKRGGWVTYVLLIDDELMPLMELHRQSRAEIEVRMEALIPTAWLYEWERNETDAPALEMYPEDHR